MDSFGGLNNGRLAVFGGLYHESENPQLALPPIWFALQIPEDKLKDPAALQIVHVQFERDVKANRPFTYA